MAIYKLSRFTKPGLLKEIDRVLLQRFLSAHGDHLRDRGVSLESPVDLDYDALVEVFMTPEANYTALAEELYIVDEMATHDGMDTLLEAAAEKGISVGGGGDVTPAEFVLRLWHQDRDLVERKHAERYLTRVRSFEYSLPPDGSSVRYQRPTGKRLRALEHDLDDWFECKQRGRGCRVFVFPKQDGTWFLVRHGEPLRREGTMDEGKQSIVVFRPEKYNVLVLEPSTGQLGINAPSKGEKELYRKKFGLHLFGDEQLFSEPGRYTLAPLSQDGEVSLVCSEVEGIEWVKLRETRFFWGGAAKEVEIRQASDLFEVYGRNGRTMPRAKLLLAKFEVKFTGANATRKLTIRPPSTAQYTRDNDKVLLEEWMVRRGFLQL